jgi:secondary thiamine-phosphate synthase enzyme
MELIDITQFCRQCLASWNQDEGLIVIYTPHTTAGITINENADPCVQSDIIQFLKQKYPHLDCFTHAEGNSPAHILSSLFSCSQTVIVHQRKMVLGTWQGIYFCEFDGPRTRQIYVKGIFT